MGYRLLVGMQGICKSMQGWMGREDAAKRTHLINRRSRSPASHPKWRRIPTKKAIEEAQHTE